MFNLSQVIANQRLQNMARTRAMPTTTVPSSMMMMTTPSALPAPVAAPASAVAPPVPAPSVTDAGTQPLRMPQRSVKGNLRDRPGSMGRGAPKRAGGAIPTVSPDVAKLLDAYSSVDEALAYSAVMKKVVALKKQGYTTSADLRVVRPPNYKELAIGAGGLPPTPNVSMTTDKPEDTPASVVYAAQGNYVGTSGDPQAAFRGVVASSIAKGQPADEVSQTSFPVGVSSVGGAGAAGFTPAETAPGAVPGHLVEKSIGIAEGYGNNAGGGAPPTPSAASEPATTKQQQQRSTMFSRKK